MYLKATILMTALCLAAAAQAPAEKIAPAKSLDAALTAMEKELVPLAEAMPEDKYSFAPSADLFKPGLKTDYKGVRTFAQTIAHISQANFFFALAIQGIAKPEPAYAEKMAGIAKLTSKQDLVKALKESLASAHSAIATITPENAWEHGGRGPNDTRAEMAMYTVAHSRDHYGQLVEYLRMNGIIPPASEGRPLANPSKTN